MASAGKHRILVDLGPALMEFAGIPQTTRQLFDLLSRCPELEVTGLIWGHSPECLLHRFYGGSRRDRQLENQAQFLNSILAHVYPRKKSAWQQTFQDFRCEWKSWACGKFSANRLDPIWSDFIWRYYLSPTLPPSERLRLGAVPCVATGLTRRYLRTRLGRFLPCPILDTRGFDTVILQYPLPLRTTLGTRKIIRCQDLVPLLYFDTQPNLSSDLRFHQRSVQACAGDSLFVTASEPVERQLQAVYPELRLQTQTIPHFVSVSSEIALPQTALDRIVESRVCSASQPGNAKALEPLTGQDLVRDGFVLAVSTLEPRKNWETLFRAFSLFRAQQDTPMRLVVVGSMGWKFESILAALRPLLKAKAAVHLAGVERAELDLLYSYARALIYPSYDEGFGLPPLEAARWGTPTILSDIPVHRWVMDEGAAYGDPYNARDLARVIAELVADEPSAQERRSRIVTEARRRLELFSEEKIRAQWLKTLLGGRPTSE